MHTFKAKPPYQVTHSIRLDAVSVSVFSRPQLEGLTV